MEWSKDKTMKLIELLQVNAILWNPSLGDTRRNKVKRKEELRTISVILEVYVADVTRKIQHLRTQYNRESAREVRVNAENPDERYVSSWYAYEYLHFLKDSNKPYRVLQSDETTIVNGLSAQSDILVDCKHPTLSPPIKISRTDFTNPVNNDVTITSPTSRDDLSVFGEYIANELRSLKGEKNLLIAKKKILDVIFEVKINSACDTTKLEPTDYALFTHVSRANTNCIHNDKVLNAPIMSTALIEPLTTTNCTPTTSINEILISSACQYS